jgi:hypothetical protein
MKRTASPARRVRESADSHMPAEDFANRKVPTVATTPRVAARRLAMLRVTASL